jgi:hypothetical protein
MTAPVAQINARKNPRRGTVEELEADFDASIDIGPPRRSPPFVPAGAAVVTLMGSVESTRGQAQCPLSRRHVISVTFGLIAPNFTNTREGRSKNELEESGRS